MSLTWNLQFSWPVGQGNWTQRPGDKCLLMVVHWHGAWQLWVGGHGLRTPVAQYLSPRPHGEFTSPGNTLYFELVVIPWSLWTLILTFPSVDVVTICSSPSLPHAKDVWPPLNSRTLNQSPGFLAPVNWIHSFSTRRRDSKDNKPQAGSWDRESCESYIN